MSKFLESIKKGWPSIKQAPWQFATSVLACAVVIGLGNLWIYSAVIDAKNATIETERTRSAGISEERDSVLRENARLVKQNEFLQVYRGQDAPPLKQRGLILAGQIREFTKNWKETDSENVKNGNVTDYLIRFGLRAQIIRDDLDMSGQHSDAYDRLIFEFRYTYEDVYAITEEVERLSKGLPED